MKLIIVVDSSSGLTKKEAEARGWYFLPLFINVDGKEFEDGIEIKSKNFFEICKKESTVSSSCSSVGQIENLLNEISKPDTFVVIYPISKHLSVQYQNCVLASKNFKNVHVIDSKNIFIPIVHELVEFETDVENKKITIQEGIDIIENNISRDKNNLILFPKTNDNLLKGGRLSPSAYKVAKLLKIIPIITLSDGKLEKLGKGRIFEKTVIKTIVDSYSKFNGTSDEYVLVLAHSNNRDIELITNEINKLTKNKTPIINILLPSVIAIHTGLEAIAPCFLKLKHDINKYEFEKIGG